MDPTSRAGMKAVSRCTLQMTVSWISEVIWLGPTFLQPAGMSSSPLFESVEDTRTDRLGTPEEPQSISQLQTPPTFIRTKQEHGK